MFSIKDCTYVVSRWVLGKAPDYNLKDVQVVDIAQGASIISAIHKGLSSTYKHETRTFELVVSKKGSTVLIGFTKLEENMSENSFYAVLPASWHYSDDSNKMVIDAILGEEYK